MNNQSIYAPNLYEQRDALAIHTGYWEQYAALKKINLYNLTFCEIMFMI